MIDYALQYTPQTGHATNRHEPDTIAFMPLPADRLTCQAGANAAKYEKTNAKSAN